MMRYVILERTPFPGYFGPMATCFLQDAELRTGLAQKWGGYHVQAQPLGALLTYAESDARLIVDHRQRSAPYAEHILFAIPGVQQT